VLSSGINTLDDHLRIHFPYKQHLDHQVPMTDYEANLRNFVNQAGCGNQPDPVYAANAKVL